MNTEEFHQLLDKYEKGTCSPQEKRLLEAFLESFQDQPADALRDKPTDKETAERLFGNIMTRSATKSDQQPRKGPNPFLWILLGLILSLSIYWGIQHFVNKTQVDPETPAIIYARLSTKAGQTQRLRLEDGTLITLNENSTLSYPEHFLPDQQRVVELQGEAYFEVAHDQARPFVAITENIKTKVLGTSFNIKARPNAAEIAVTLVEGKVEIAKTNNIQLDTLHPGEHLTYSKTDSISSKTSFLGNVLYAWKEDTIIFQDASVREVTEVLSKKYDTVFYIERENEFESLLVTQINTKRYKLNQVLGIITQVTDFQFRTNKDGSITVSPK